MPHQHEERDSLNEANYQDIRIPTSMLPRRIFFFNGNVEHGTNETNCVELCDASAEPVTGLIIDNAVVVDEVTDDGDFFSTSIILPSCFIIIVVNAICLCTFYIFAQEMSLAKLPPGTNHNNAPNDDTPDDNPLLDDYFPKETSSKDVILRANVSNEHDLSNAASPQGKALAWILGEERAAPLRNDRTPQEMIQRYVLVVLYYSFNGDKWTDRCQFLTKGMIECDWKKSIDNLSARPQCGITCDDNGLVQRINLEQNNLSGMIPTEIGHLTSVQYVSLWGNKINGVIPSSIVDEMNALEFFSLSFNKLSGTIPLSLGHMASLVDVRLSNQNLTGVDALCAQLESHHNAKLEAVCDIEELSNQDPQCDRLASVTCCDVDERQNKWRCCTTAIDAGKKIFCYDPYDPFHMHFP